MEAAGPPWRRPAGQRFGSAVEGADWPLTHWEPPVPRRPQRVRDPNCFWTSTARGFTEGRGGHGHDNRGRIVEFACAALRNKQPVGVSLRLIDAAAEVQAAKIGKECGDDLDLTLNNIGGKFGGVPARWRHGATRLFCRGKVYGSQFRLRQQQQNGCSNNGGNAMKSATPGYESKSTVSGAVGEARDNAANGKSGKQQ